VPRGPAPPPPAAPAPAPQAAPTRLDGGLEAALQPPLEALDRGVGGGHKAAVAVLVLVEPQGALGALGRGVGARGVLQWAGRRPVRRGGARGPRGGRGPTGPARAAAARPGAPWLKPGPTQPLAPNTHPSGPPSKKSPTHLGSDGQHNADALGARALGARHDRLAPAPPVGALGVLQVIEGRDDGQRGDLGGCAPFGGWVGGRRGRGAGGETGWPRVRRARGGGPRPRAAARGMALREEVRGGAGREGGWPVAVGAAAQAGRARGAALPCQGAPRARAHARPGPRSLCAHDGGRRKRRQQQRRERAPSRHRSGAPAARGRGRALSVRGARPQQAASSGRARAPRRRVGAAWGRAAVPGASRPRILSFSRPGRARGAAGRPPALAGARSCPACPGPEPAAHLCIWVRYAPDPSRRPAGPLAIAWLVPSRGETPTATRMVGKRG
jgi:hypothetical protein